MSEVEQLQNELAAEQQKVIMAAQVCQIQ